MKKRYNMLMLAYPNKVGADQRGFASIIIAIVLVLVLSLTTVGFAQLMRNEQNSATSRHLSEQAYYAAETGLNDAAKAINAGFDQSKTTCGPLNSGSPLISTPGSQYLTNNIVTNSTADPSADNSWTCLLIDPTPLDLKFQPKTETTTATTLSGVDANSPNVPKQVSELDISWQSVDTNCNSNATSFVPAAAGTSFLPTINWPCTGALRVGITPLDGGIDRNSLINSTYVAFLYPNKANAAPGVSAYDPTTTGDNSGVIVRGNCDTGHVPTYDHFCNAQITGLPATNYLLTLRSIYSDTDVTIAARGVGAAQPLLRIRNAQTVVDSTGKAQDILRRVQARVRSKNSFDYPSYVLETTGNICKQLQLLPGGVSGPDCNP